MSTTQKAVIFKEVPEGFPEPGKHLTVEDRTIDLESEPLHGGVLVKVFYTSLDPYLRGRMRDASKPSYMPAFTLNDPIASAMVGRVVRSESSQFAVGDTVASFYGPNSEYGVLPAALFEKMGMRKVENPHNLPLSYFIGCLGMPGTTVHEGLYRIGQPKKGETLFVSSAAGAVGEMVGQVAKAEGLRVIGSAGSKEKCDYVKSLGFDEVFNYKEEKPLDALQRLAPEGIDIYWDNVGGETLDAALLCMKRFGRIVACGAIANYNSPPEEWYGVKNTFTIVSKNLRMEGFICNLAMPKYNAMLEKFAPMIAEGKIRPKEHIYEGIEKGPEALCNLFTGKNFGKSILKISDPDVFKSA